MANYLRNIDLPMVGEVLERNQSIQAFMDKERAVGTMIDFATNTNAVKTPFLYIAKDGAKGVLELDLNIDSKGNYAKDQIVNVLTDGIVCLECDSTLSSAEFGAVVYWDSSASKVTTTQSSNEKIGSVASNTFKAQKVGASEVTDAIFVKIENSVGA